MASQGTTAAVDRTRVSGIDRFFKISERGSTFRTRDHGAASPTFFTMAYIVVLNPIILGGAADVYGARLDFAQLATSTALVAAVMTIIMGVGRQRAARPGRRARAQRRRRLPARRRTCRGPAAMGIVVLEGLAHPRARARPACARPCSTPSRCRSSRRSASASGCSSRFIGFVDAGFARRTGRRGPGAGQPRHRRAPARLAHRRVRRRPARSPSCSSPARSAAPSSSASSSRRSSPWSFRPSSMCRPRWLRTARDAERLGAQRAGRPRPDLRLRPTSACSATSALRARSRRSA